MTVKPSAKSLAEASIIEESLTNILNDFTWLSSDQRPLNQQLGSLQLVRLIIQIEKVFQIEISPADYDPNDFTSLERLVKLIMRAYRPGE